MDEFFIPEDEEEKGRRLDWISRIVILAAKLTKGEQPAHANLVNDYYLHRGFMESNDSETDKAWREEMKGTEPDRSALLEEAIETLDVFLQIDNKK